MPNQTPTLLLGKTVLITGAARRVGAVIARKMHAAGANIVLHYRSSAVAAQNLAHELEHARHHSVTCVQADLLDVHALAPLIAAALDAFGRL
ncbi:MAG TPA: SDR family NAD(P)-dependent oxidoreductase, partial [Steroidobacteraceae bacterium]